MRDYAASKCSKMVKRFLNSPLWLKLKLALGKSKAREVIVDMYLDKIMDKFV